MSAFEPLAFWRAYGACVAGPGAATPEHVEQEARLREVLAAIDPPATILDVGCGRGRLAAVLRDLFPEAAYSGLDLGPAQLEAVAEVWPGCETIDCPIEDFDPADRRWDLVLTSEVLLHVPPERIERAVAALLRAAAGALILIEWAPSAEELRQPIAEGNWPHDYPALVGPPTRVEFVRRQAIYLFAPPEAPIGLTAGVAGM